jgi:hypothetical protein
LGLTESVVKLKKLKVYWLIEGQNAQIQIQELKWKRRSTSRPTIEFGKNAIKLILKIKIYNWELDWTNHKLMTDLEIDMFWHHFLLNEMACFEQNIIVSCIVHWKIKRAANSVILMALFAIFFPWTRRCRQRRNLFPCICLSQKPKNNKIQALQATLRPLPNDRPTTLPLCHD